MPPPTPLTLIFDRCQTGEEIADALLKLEAQVARLRLPPPPGAATPERCAEMAHWLQEKLDTFQARQEADFAQHGSYRIGPSMIHDIAFALPVWYHDAAKAFAAHEERKRLPWWKRR